MRRLAVSLIALVVLGSSVVAAAPAAAADQGHMMGQGQMPMMGHRQMMEHHGMLGHRQMMEHHGMMGHRQMMGGRRHGAGHGGSGAGMKQGMGQGMGPGMGKRVVAMPHLSTDDVRHFLAHRLERQGYKRLKVGKVAAKDEETIAAEIVTLDDSLVQSLEIDRHSGWITSID